MSKSFPEWWKHGQKVRTANDGVLTLNIAEDSEYWLTNNAGKEVSVFSMDILGPASVPEACRMTTDITELAQRARINAECGEHLSPAETMELVEALESEKRICATWRKTAEANSEKMEKAQTINAAAEKLVRCKGRYHSEQNYRALAALFGVTTPDLPPLDGDSSTVTVKLTDINEYLAEVHDKTLNRAFRLLAEGVRAGDVAAMRAAGIKVEAE